MLINPLPQKVLRHLTKYFFYRTEQERMEDEETDDWDDEDGWTDDEYALIEANEVDEELRYDEDNQAAIWETIVHAAGAL